MTDRTEDAARAQALHEQACELDDAEAALALYREALALDPARPSTHYDIGLIHKYRGEWAASLRHNRLAIDLRPDDEASNWNLAIAATALRDWAEARAAWARVGIEVADGHGPIEDDFGITPVRLAPDGNGEVVWARRIDPVRARIENIPFAASGYRHGDVVLHDGAPVGERRRGEHTYGVFNVLELFETSGKGTFEAEVRPGDDAALQGLASALEAAGVEFENWTQSVRLLCRQCSEGLPHEHHDQERPKPAPDTRVLGFGTHDPARAEAVLRAWDAGAGRLLRFDVVLAPR